MSVTCDDILDVLRTIPDPEMPISIVDLGLVERVSVCGNGSEGASGAPSSVTVDLLPTFIGCPALDMIAGDVRAKLCKLPGVQNVDVNWLFDPPWSVDRITPAGRASLADHGVTVPAGGNRLNLPGHDGTLQLRTSAIPCPFCGSRSTQLDSPFGPTRCRMIYYCNACRNSFEHMKRI
jgi:ring-1,2-phenylacetyl-CoA epoxidase subunit PaaD